MTEITIPKYSDPDLDGIIDQDVLDRFEGSCVMWGDIINTQLIKTYKELIAGKGEILDRLDRIEKAIWDTDASDIND